MPAILKRELMRQLRARRRAERLAAMPERACAACGEPMPATVRPHARVCSPTCRSRLSRARTAPLRLNRDEAGDVWYWASRWVIQESDGGTRQLNMDGIRFTLSVKFRGNLMVEATADNGRLEGWITNCGVVIWHRQNARLERLFLAVARRMWLPPYDETTDFQRLIARSS
jgi:hypothetical protein